MNETIDRLIDASTINEISSFVPVELNDASNATESMALTDYVTSGLDDKKSNDVVKIIAAAMQIASESGELETPSSSPHQTAVAAVNITHNLNLSYLLEQGQITIEEAVDNLIDQATAIASAVAEVVLSPQFLERGMNYALDFMSTVFPPVKPLVDFAKNYTQKIAAFISEKALPKVKKGIQKVSRKLKSLWHSFIDKITTLPKTMVEKVLDKAEPFI